MEEETNQTSILEELAIEGVKAIYPGTAYDYGKELSEENEEISEKIATTLIDRLFYRDNLKNEQIIDEDSFEWGVRLLDKLGKKPEDIATKIDDVHRNLLYPNSRTGRRCYTNAGTTIAWKKDQGEKEYLSHYSLLEYVSNIIMHRISIHGEEGMNEKYSRELTKELYRKLTPKKFEKETEKITRFHNSYLTSDGKVIAKLLVAEILEASPSRRKMYLEERESEFRKINEEIKSAVDNKISRLNQLNKYLGRIKNVLGEKEYEKNYEVIEKKIDFYKAELPEKREEITSKARKIFNRAEQQKSDLADNILEEYNEK